MSTTLALKDIVNSVKKYSDNNELFAIAISSIAKAFAKVNHGFPYLKRTFWRDTVSVFRAFAVVII